MVLWLALTGHGILSACSPVNHATPPSATSSTPQSHLELWPTLQRYQYPTETATPASEEVQILSAAATPTPRVHVIKEGDTLISIAMKYGLSLDSLILANPLVNPNALTNGAELIIPAPDEEGKTSALQPTPLPVSVSPAWCARDIEQRILCFAQVHNPLPAATEGVEITFRYQKQDGSLTEKKACSLLRQIPAGSTAVLYAVFEPDPDWNGRTSAELSRAIPARSDLNPLTVEIEDTDILSAKNAAWVSGRFSNPPAEGKIWLLLTAFNEQGQSCGVRRFDIQASETAFRQMVFCVQGELTQVTAEAQPAP